MPKIVENKDGGEVEKNHKVHLTCDDPTAAIYYTTDGSDPDLHQPKTKVRMAILSKTCTK